MEAFEIEKYKDIALRRRWWIIIPFLLSILIGVGLSLVRPKSYRASTLILVQPQKVPASFVREIVSVGIEDRLRTITQQVTSRTNLEKIINEFNLYNEPDRHMFMEEKVEKLRKKISVDVSRGGSRGANAFQIFFEGKYPKIVAEVANTLSSYFITENLKLREDQAIGTSDFLADELDSIKRRLEEKEDLLAKYRQRYMGAMPEQLETNFNILGRLQNQLEQLNSNLRAAKERKLIIQQQISNAEMMKKQMAESGIDNSLVTIDMLASSQDTDSKEIISLKDKLASLESRYTAKHPDIIRLKRMIAKIEAEQTESIKEKEESETAMNEVELKPGFAMIDLLMPQFHQIDIEIKNLKTEINKVKSQVESYEHKVEEVPQREQEMLSLTRDYQNLKALYNSLLKRKLEAKIAVNMERKQKGEQFRILDSAKVPIIPFKPNIRRILLMTVALGFALGCGLAYLRETMDTSLRRPEEIEALLQIPVLASLPFTYTAKEMRRRKRRKILTVVSVSLGFIFSGVGIVLYLKGIDATINFIKDIFKSL